MSLLLPWPRSAALLLAAAMAGCSTPQLPTTTTAAAPKGELTEGPTTHTAESLRNLVAHAQLALPSAATGGAAFFGKFKDAPATATTRVPVVIFLHGSSGPGLA